jgi:hypothetical protein
MTKESNKDLSKLRSEMDKDVTMVPCWVNTRNMIDKEVWGCVVEIIKVVSKLSSTRVLADRTIEGYIIEVNEYVLDIVMLADQEEIEIESSHYILNCIEKYLQMAVELELYESAENLFNFKKRYLGK